MSSTIAAQMLIKFIIVGTDATFDDCLCIIKMIGHKNHFLKND